MNDCAEIYLFRHGEALNNINSHLITGRGDDVPLVVTGELQAKLLGEALAKVDLTPDFVFSSPALRAKRTGEIVLDVMNIDTDIILDDRLHEQHIGDWTGQLAQDIFTEEMVRTIEVDGKDFRSPNGESMNDVGERMVDWANSVTSDAGEAHKIFAFTHGGSIRCLASRILNWTHAQTYQTKPHNTSVSIFQRNMGGLWGVRALNVDAKELIG